MPEQHLNDADIHPVFEQVRGKGMTQCMEDDRFIDISARMGFVNDAVELARAER